MLFQRIWQPKILENRPRNNPWLSWTALAMVFSSRHPMLGRGIEEGRDPAIAREKEKEQHGHVGVKAPAKHTDGSDVKADQHAARSRAGPSAKRWPANRRFRRPAWHIAEPTAIQRCSRISAREGRMRHRPTGSSTIAATRRWPNRARWSTISCTPRQPIKQARDKTRPGHGPSADRGWSSRNAPRRRAARISR